MVLSKRHSGRQNKTHGIKTNAADLRSHISLKNIKNFIRAHGVKVKIFKAITCPCLKESSDQASIVCGVCRGSGFAHIGLTDNNNTNCVTKRIVMGGRTVHNNLFRKGGKLKSGGTNAVIFDYLPSVGDLFRPSTDIEIINDEFHKRGHVYENGKSSEVLYNRTIIGVEGIYTINEDKSQIINYRPGIDFTMDDRKIIWSSQPEAINPSLGQRYAVRYQAIPDYIVMDAGPSFHIEHDQDEPEAVRELLDKPIVYDVTLTRVDQVLKGRHNEKTV